MNFACLHILFSVCVESEVFDVQWQHLLHSYTSGRPGSIFLSSDNERRTFEVPFSSSRKRGDRPLSGSILEASILLINSTINPIQVRIIYCIALLQDLSFRCCVTFQLWRSFYFFLSCVHWKGVHRR